MVSVILPTYNRAHYIAAAIDSVVGQTFEQWELIIVDDGSTDNTSEVVRQFNDVRIKYCWIPHQGFLGKVRNYGMNKAAGDIIAFLDSDDLWRKDKLAVQLRLLEEHPNSIFVISNGEEVGVGSIITPEYQPLFVGGLLLPILEHGKFCFYLPSFIFKKEALNTIAMFDESVPSACDIHFFFRMSSQFSGIFTNEKLITIRKHDSNITLFNGTIAYENTLRLLHEFRINQTITSALYDSLAARNHYQIGLHNLRSGKQAMARKHFALALRLMPGNWKPFVRWAQTFLSNKPAATT